MRSNRFGIPGVISVIALVFAMVGGAYAANKYVITSTSQIKPSVLKSLQGKQGKEGKQGPAGAKGDNGSNGSAGAKGDAGAAGAAGAQGPPGPKGKDGAEGPQGVSGQPWTPDGFLPVGATETGAYLLGAEGGTGFFGAAKAAISFTIPLKNPTSNAVFILQGDDPPATCENAAHPGDSSPENPEASPGFLCVYEVGLNPSDWDKLVEFTNPSNGGGIGAGTTGTILNREPPETGAAGAFSSGTWAVTAAP